MSRDGALDIIRSNNVVSASQTVIAQWNQNRYIKPKIFGYYSNSSPTATPNNYYTTNDTSIDKTFTSNTAQNLMYPSAIATSWNTSNAVRITFEAKITSITGGTPDDLTEWAVVAGATDVYGTTTTDEDTTQINLYQGSFNQYEIYYCSNNDSTSYFSNLNIKIYPTNDLNQSTVVVTIRNVNVSYLSTDEINRNQHDRLNWVFQPNKPGDQLLENSLLSTNKITKYFIPTEQFSDTATDLIPSLLSPYNENIYYITPKNSTTNHNIYIEYLSEIKCNQIYIKTQDTGVSVSGRSLTYKNTIFSVYLKVNGAWSTTPIYSETSGTSDFCVDGSIILQRVNGAWQAGYDESSITQISDINGQFITSPQSIQGIRIQMNAIESRVIEISPRLAINLSNFLVSSDSEQNIDEGNYPIPVGNISSNNGTLVFENLPRWGDAPVESGPLFQIFNNNTTTALYGLLKSDVKFTVSTTVFDSKKSSVHSFKNFTMFANSWNEDQDETVTVELSDYGKYLQSAACPDILMLKVFQPNFAGSLKQSLETMMQFGGFSDYDYDSLNTVCSNLKTKTGITSPIFYSSKEQKIWEVLSEICLGYQISAYFDERGILKFKDILRELKTGTYDTNSSEYFKITSAINGNYLPNIVSLNIKKNEDIGKIDFSFKVRSLTNSLFSVNGKQLDKVDPNFGVKLLNKISNSSTIPWTLTTEDSGLICANLISTLDLKSSSAQLGNWTTSNANVQKPRYITSYSGYGVIEGEIISWDGIEYVFTYTGGSQIKIVKSEEDKFEKLSQIISSVGNAQVSYKPNGKIMNLQRGLFGTSAAIHYSNINSDPSMRLGSTGINATTLSTSAIASLNKSSETDFQSQFYTMPIPANSVGYLLFSNKDSNQYNKYRVIFRPTQSAESFGFFIGGAPNGSGGLAYNSLRDFSGGIFIEFLPDTNASKYKVIIRSGPERGTTTNILYRSTDNYFHDTWKPSEWEPIYKKDSKGKFIYDDKNKKIIEKRVYKKYPASQQAININLDKSKFSVTLNGKVINFYSYSGGVDGTTKIQKIPVLNVSRGSRIFGLFCQNDNVNALGPIATNIKILEVQATAPGQLMDKQISWDEQNIGAQSLESNLNFLTNTSLQDVTNKKNPSNPISSGFVRKVRPFSLRAEPLLRGIAIFDIKLADEKPYFNLKTIPPYGIDSAQTIKEYSVKNSIYCGTPFRGRIAFLNTLDEIAPISSDIQTFVSAKVVGSSIVEKDHKISSNISNYPGAQTIEISSKWMDDTGSAQRMLSNLCNNINSMNSIYEVEIFGNPALRAGDYVYISYAEKNITSYALISSVKNNFSDGGVTTNLVLRTLNSYN